LGKGKKKTQPLGKKIRRTLRNQKRQKEGEGETKIKKAKSDFQSQGTLFGEKGKRKKKKNPAGVKRGKEHTGDVD